MPDAYARLDDFETVIKALTADEKTEPLELSLPQLTATMSLLLRVYILPEVHGGLALMVRELVDVYSKEVIRRYPFAEGYVDFLYGAAEMRRQGF